MVKPVYDYHLDIAFICGHTETTLICAETRRQAERVADFASLKVCCGCRVAANQALSREVAR